MLVPGDVEGSNKIEGVWGHKCILKQHVFAQTFFLLSPASGNVVLTGLARSVDPGGLAATEFQHYYRHLNICIVHKHKTVHKIFATASFSHLLVGQSWSVDTDDSPHMPRHRPIAASNTNTSLLRRQRSTTRGALNQYKLMTSCSGRRYKQPEEGLSGEVGEGWLLNKHSVWSLGVSVFTCCHTSNNCYFFLTTLVFFIPYKKLKRTAGHNLWSKQSCCIM